jgi:hypothetical protein
MAFVMLGMLGESGLGGTSREKGKCGESEKGTAQLCAPRVRGKEAAGLRV